MRIKDVFEKIHTIQILKDSHLVLETVAREIIERFPHIKMKKVSEFEKSQGGILNILIASSEQLDSLKAEKIEIDQEKYVYLRLAADGAGWLISSHSYFIYAYINNLLEDQLEDDADKYKQGKLTDLSFSWQRSLYDYFLTQPGRIQKNLNRETYIQQLAKFGITHVEVNGLAYPMALESGPEGETYPMFYTYCPALDQFVYSRLNKGIYPYYYLSANLKYLKENAQMAKKYGLVPGLLSFEPRSVPERFFEKYPMLRGARVDHPFRSFKPRYNMTITHPKVLEHYAEMMKKVLLEVPEISFFTIWTNDSGAGFEYTKSLYVGRNGGAYLIREWKSDEEIARQAGENVLRFYRTLIKAGREINPDFRVITRMEPFYGEHETVWNGLGDHLDVETNSLAAIGWKMPYAHPKYPDNNDISGGTIYQMGFDPREKKAIDELTQKGAQAHFYFSVGPHVMFDPLMGIPFPKLTYQRLKMLHENGVNYLAHHGGIYPPEHVPFNVNHEIVKQFQYDPELNIDLAVKKLALKWAGEKFYENLLKAWEAAEDAVLAFPNVISLYSTFGFSWYRLWVRPFVPNFEAIPREERAYYEDYSCTTPHNPNNVDLSRDVLFQLTTPEKSRLNMERIDQNVWEPLDTAIRILEEINGEAAKELGEQNVIKDQLIRLKALHCWIMTQRNVAAWITGVYSYLNTSDDAEKASAKELLKDMIGKEIENTEQLAEILDSGVEFMSMTDKGETPLIYGSNLKELLPKRIELMKKHIDDEPFIDPDYIEKQAGEMIP